ncbi:MAG: plasmid mobilization protein [Verrucomicrobiota bacterium]
MPTLTFKVTVEEAQRIRALARQQKLSVSEFLRRQAQPHQESSGPIPRFECGHTGAIIFGSAEGLPALNTESVRHLLANFP